GLVGPISSVSVTLNNYTTPRPQQVDFLLVGPGGQKFIIVSDVGGTGAGSASNNINLTLSDAGATLIGQNPGGAQALVSGTFKPSDYDASVNFPTSAPPYQSPAPLGSATFTSVFGGLSGASVNGNWVLHVFDSSAGSGTSTVAGGWSIDIVTTAAASTTTTLASSLNPSFTNQAVTLTSTTTSSSTVNIGNVNFVDNTTSTTLCSNVAVNGSGQATCNIPANTLTERIHNITATYVGNATFATSNGSVNQTVNCPTTGASPTFTNGCGITIPDAGAPTPAIPYPSNIIVSGLSGSISKVTLTLTNANLPVTSHFNFMLVGPGGQNFVFFSDAGGNVASTGVNISLDDTAASQLPNSGSIASGTYRPADYNVDSDPFPAPAPVPTNFAAPNGSATFASLYGGSAPNGTWSLYASDDTGGGANGTIGSWSLTFTTSGDAATTTVVTANPNPATTAQPVTFTATVTSSSTVNAGTVTFRRGATILCANVPVVSGVATCNQPAFTQGDYIITADYNGAPGQFNISSGNVTLQVNSPTIKTGLNFANNGGITINDASTASPYPSRIIVNGLGGTLTKVTLQMNGINSINPDHTDFLLVGPGGQKFLFMGDAGGTTDMVNVNLVLDDAAGTALPDSTAITSGTYKPAAYTGDPDVFPAPAPASPYNPAAPEGAGTFALFNGISPNGTWSLYAVEDTGDATNVTISNWSLTFTLAAAATTTSVTSSADPSVFGQPVTFTATVATAGLGTPTGNVQFFDGANPIGGAVALNASGQAQVTTSSLTVGNHTITANYAGDVPNGFNSSSGSLNTNPQTVNQASTTTGLTSNQSNPVGTGVPVTYTATVNPVAPGAGTRTGTVTFRRNGSPVCSNVAINVSGQATCTISFSLAGNYNITAAYSGDTNFTASSSPTFVQQVVGPTAAPVDVSGRVFSQETGMAVYNARVVMIDSSGQTRMAITNPFGYFRFTEVLSGATYTFTVSAKTYQTQSIVRSITDEVTDFEIQLER
ncbi:MAG TPA: Ig-like domain repeat protein, partial [Pyrinomonadaceae bacterium]|nr:Ig-like domain repeat protein [Pyrinomonadaceae bacterium]